MKVPKLNEDFPSPDANFLVSEFVKCSIETFFGPLGQLFEVTQKITGCSSTYKEAEMKGETRIKAEPLEFKISLFCCHFRAVVCSTLTIVLSNTLLDAGSVHHSLIPICCIVPISSYIHFSLSLIL